MKNGRRDVPPPGGGRGTFPKPHNYPSALSALASAFALLFALVLVARMYLMQTSFHVSAGLTDIIP